MNHCNFEFVLKLIIIFLIINQKLKYELQIEPVQNHFPVDGHWHVPLTQINDVFCKHCDVVLHFSVFDEYGTLIIIEQK